MVTINYTYKKLASFKLIYCKLCKALLGGRTDMGNPDMETDTYCVACLDMVALAESDLAESGEDLEPIAFPVCAKCGGNHQNCIH